MAHENEMLVEKIRSGYCVAENMQMLYENNLPLIKKFIRPYAAYEPMEDILQESYFGLWEAVRHYESSENVQFITYAKFWIIRSVQKYIEKCGSTVRIPSHQRQKIAHCRRAIEQIGQELGREPTNGEIAVLMGISVEEVQGIKGYMRGVGSLDTPLAEDKSLTLAEVLQDGFDLESEAINKIYAEYSKTELWKIVERYTGERENRIIKDIFIHCKSMAVIAGEQGISLDRVRQIKEKGLWELRVGKARRELLEKFEIAEAGLYRGGLANYREQYFTSIVERTAIRRMEAEERYKQHLKDTEEMHRKRVFWNTSKNMSTREERKNGCDTNWNSFSNRGDYVFDRIRSEEHIGNQR